MADISVIKMPDNSSYNLKDAAARQDIEYLKGTNGFDYGIIKSKNLNITPYDWYEEPYTNNGVTFTCNSDHSVTITGNPSNMNYGKLTEEYRWLLPAGTYTLSGGLHSYINVELFLYKEKNSSSQTQNIVSGMNPTGGSKTFTTTQDYWASIRIFVHSNTDLSEAVVIKPQLEAGTIATEYEDPFNTYTGSKKLNQTITEVRLNNTIISGNGIANIPMASSTNFGVVKPLGNAGIYIATSDGNLCVDKASSGGIKAGTNAYNPIVPQLLHEAVFFGLAKAANADMASIQDTTVGVYPNAQKQAIQNMLGITDLLSTEESSTAAAAHTINSLFMMDGKLHRATSAIAIGDAVVEGTNCTQTTIDEAFLKVTTASDTYALKDNPVFTSAMSLGRKANTEVGYLSFARGYNVTASGYCSNAEGHNTVASGQYAHTEGISTKASYDCAHAEGIQSVASGQGAHAEGGHTVASGSYAHAEGLASSASAITAHAEGEITTASGEASHTEGLGTIANHLAQRAGGRFNIADTSSAAANANGNYIEIIGNGTSSSARSNAYALDWNGNGHYNGYVYVGCNADSTSGTRLPHDIQINGNSIVSNGIATIPVRSNVNSSSTDLVTSAGISGAFSAAFGTTDAQIKGGTQTSCAIAPVNQHKAVFYGLAKAAGDTTQSSSDNAVGTYTSGAKTVIQAMLGVEPGVTLIETVSGTTPTITALPNVRYNCGEVSTISITPPANGTCDVFFTSGSTAAVLTVPSTVKWPAWFDATALETDMIYEIMITDGVYGSVMTWES